MNTPSRALILGASGGIGGEVARQLRAAGWQINALTRRTPSGEDYHWITADALSRAEVVHAARDCEVIVHAVNPAGYRHWDTQVMPMLENTLTAARQHGATVVLPGTVYNFGADTFPVIAEDAPQQPQTRKGGIRAAMEQRLQEFVSEGGRALIVRAGDFFGPAAGNNWFAQGLIKPGKTITTVSNPGRAGVGHQWAYLPDVAATMVALLGHRTQLCPLEKVHLAGHWDEDGSAMAAAICRVVARYSSQSPRIATFPWWLVHLLAPFQTTFRELKEMQYLWQQPVRLSNARLLSLLGHEPHTPLDRAVEATLRALGCLPA
ncbi:MAG: sugar nucleotide-binding protein [Pantoea sp.]|uniref:NAD-dependent epimerase/dehydratase family protein n=1 Tax=Pantoea sp. TaxID=69393 RepID=UPI002384EF25|nr:NAD-dependent epimerase/dehydratase family protein [Pantoea sp.]MDE1186439.1 sugar nucleotide-binding protein [Pantoea sp.]